MAIDCSELVLGIDGGGSRTRAWLCGLDGSVVGLGEAGASNLFQLGVDRACRSIVEAGAAAWREAGLDSGRFPPPFRAVCAGVAGAGAEEDQQVLAGAVAMALRCDPQRCRIEHDLRIALAGALAGSPGAVLVAGTGSACYGRLSDGRSWRAGGWGSALDDGGSGYWLALQALRHVVRVGDGRSAVSPLSEAMVARLGTRAPREVLRFVRDPAQERSRIAALAPLVLAVAESGDPVAAGIMSRGAEELAAMAGAVLRELGLGAAGPARVAPVGGVFDHHPSYTRLVGALLAKTVAAATMQPALLPPCAGAVLLALETAGVPGGPEVTRQLKTRAAASAAAR